MSLNDINRPPTNPPIEIRLRILSAVDYAPGKTTRARIKAVNKRTFSDINTGINYTFTWRSISTWLYRFKKHGVLTLDTKTRSDKDSYRKLQVNELAEVINDNSSKFQ
jgi:putative transposase